MKIGRFLVFFIGFLIGLLLATFIFQDAPATNGMSEIERINVGKSIEERVRFLEVRMEILENAR